ncbi:MAG: FAD-dependent oxidoreductase [Pseudomonadota bacterium]
MEDIPYKYKGSILNPLKTLGFFARKPVTVPLEPREAAVNYRGFHVNDWELCIGCSTCQKVCDNAAITMVRIPGLPEDPVKGIRNERPAIDYGRCCWCGLCVDICPTSSISLTREYVHTCREDELDSYFILPDPNGMHGEYYPKGWAKTDDADLVDLDRQSMPEQGPEERLQSFGEFVGGYDTQQAIVEASRCVQCGMCHDSCPANMHAPEYIRAIWEQDLEEAVRQIYRTNPFAHVCGRICTRRCEAACSIGVRGEPVAIRWLKRYAMDSVGHERVREIATENRGDYLSGHKVAVIGAGPAGLTAACDLARNGHQVTVFEALPEPGGMMRYGIPSYRLPYNRIDDDVDVIRAMGVEIHCNTRIGEDVSMAELQQDYDAVLLALGLPFGRSTRIPGSEHKDVRSAVDLLRRISLDEELEIPKAAVVIGGGNTAMDIARSMARLQIDRHGKADITVTALEDADHLLADPDEIRETGEEGITILPGRGPKQCEVNAAGDLVGLTTVGVISVFDSEGRFAPQYDESDIQRHEAGMVIEAIGQLADTELLGEELTEQLEWNRGRLQIDAGCRTSEDWLWAAGDLVNGPDVIHAVADGHRVATSIDNYLSQQVEATS